MSLAGPAGRAVPLFEEALALWRELGDKAGSARALNGLAFAATENGEYAVAGARLEESVSLQRDLGGAPGVAETLLRLGECALQQGDTTRATQFFDEHLAQARALGDTITIASALLSRGEVAMRRGEFAEAEALMAESLALSRKVGATIWMGGALHRSAVLAAWQGHFEQAAARFGEYLTLQQSSGEDAECIDGIRLCLAWITSCRGQHERAVALARESLKTLRETGDRGSLAYGLMILGGAVQARGEEVHARVLFQESLRLVRGGKETWGDKIIIVQDLAGLARIVAAEGQPERAVVLYGASEAYRATAPFPLAPPEEEARDQVLAAARAALGEEAFVAAWARGQAMPLDEAIALALEDRDAVDQ
jgi:tetratricopeptide (TPR) repeat protein